MILMSTLRELSKTASLAPIGRTVTETSSAKGRALKSKEKKSSRNCNGVVDDDDNNNVVVFLLFLQLALSLTATVNLTNHS